MKEFKIFFVAITIIITALMFDMLLEPETIGQCMSATMVDKYIDNDNTETAVFDAPERIIKIVGDEEVYYQNQIGDVVTVCENVKVYTKLNMDWIVLKNISQEN